MAKEDNSYKVLDKLSKWYDSLTSKKAFVQWRRNYPKFIRMYYGDDPFGYTGEYELKTKYIRPVSANIVSPLVNTLCGVEIQNRYRVKVAVDSEEQEARELEEGINSYLRKAQELNYSDSKLASALKDSIIGGIGWVKVYYEDKKPVVEYVPAWNVIFDTDDFSAGYSEQDKIFRLHYWSSKKILSKFGKSALSLSFNDNEDLSEESKQTDLGDFYGGCSHRVVECVFNETTKGWRGHREDGALVTTIDQDIAEQYLSDVETIVCNVQYEAWICQGKLLKHRRLEPTMIDAELPYIPVIFYKSEYPRGLVEQVMSLQHDINITLSKRSAYCDAERMFIHSNNPNVRKAIWEKPGKFQSPNAVIALDKEDLVTFSRQSEAVNSHMHVLTSYMELIKRASGIEDESRGIPTNANSGIAQKLREQTSLRTNAFVYANFELFKRRVSKLMVQQLQSSFDQNILVEVGENKDSFYLNWSVQDADGNFRILHDITYQKFSITTEEAPVYSRGAEARKDEFERFMQLPPQFANFIWQSEDLLGMYFENPKRIKESIMKTQMALQQAAGNAPVVPQGNNVQS